MAKQVSRVKGKGSEVMELADGKVVFRTAGHAYTMDADKVAVMQVMNGEDARAFVEESPSDVLGLWAYNGMPSAKGKNVYLVCRDTVKRWIMEVSKSQAPNAVRLAQTVCPKSKEEEEEEIKLYAAIQTPRGALFTVGSIACVIGASFALGNFQQPLIALVLAGAAIFMFLKIE